MIKIELERHETDEGLVWFSFPQLDELRFLKHWITSRHGGISTGGWATLNLGDHVGEDVETVMKNRTTVSEALAGGKDIYLPEQIHSDLTIEVSSVGEKRCKCDGVMVAEAGVPVAVLTADCLPIIIADRVKKVASAVHAGRQGVFSNIAGKTVSAMIEKYGSSPQDLTAVVAPGIKDCCYEVSEDLFEGDDATFKKYLTPKGTLDMVSAVNDQLVDAGLLGNSIFDSGVCTSCSNDDFFSHRKQKGKAGRFMTGIQIIF